METTLTCPNGHTFTTRAKRGGTTGCPRCYADDKRRVSVRVPVAAAPSASLAPVGGAAPAEAEAARLAALWAAEGPALGPRAAAAQFGEPAGDPCPKGHPRQWTPEHTGLLCPECWTWAPSPASAARGQQLAEARAAARTRADGRREAAHPPGCECKTCRAGRRQLEHQRRGVAAYLEGMREVLEAAREAAEASRDSYTARLAEQAAEGGEDYAAEIADATSAAVLAEIQAELKDIRDDSGFGALAAYLERHRQQQEYARRQAEHERQGAEAPARPRELSTPRAPTLPPGGPRRPAITSGPPAEGLGGPYPGGAHVMTRGEIERQFEQRAGITIPAGMAYGLMVTDQRRERNGTCEAGKHGVVAKANGANIAARVYAPGAPGAWNQGGGLYFAPGAAPVRACPKHYAEAERIIMQRYGIPSAQVVYQELEP